MMEARYIPTWLCAGNQLPGLCVASLHDELRDLRGLARARFSNKDCCLAAVDHVHKVCPCLPHRQTCEVTGR